MGDEMKTESPTSQNDSGNSGSNCQNWQDCDEADLEAMRGDNVGDTVYSTKWILQTLVTLSKIGEEGCSDRLENDLCILWDMTAEKDVVLFLMENDFLEIAQFILNVTKEPRFKEIIVGIIGNMCCQESVLLSVANAENLVSTIFNLLCTDDTETLLQIVRLFQGTLWEMQKNSKSEWFRHFKNYTYFGERLSFILQSSTNDDLLSGCLELLALISIVESPEGNFFLSDLVDLDHLFPALVEAFSQFVQKSDVAHSYKQLKFIDNWLAVFSNILQSNIGESSEWLNDTSISGIVAVLSKIIEPYTSCENLFPLDKKLTSCIHDSVDIVYWLQRNRKITESNIICQIVTIMYQLRSATSEEEASGDWMTETREANEELVRRLERYWIDTVRMEDENELSKIFQNCGKEVAECAVDVVKKYSEEYPDGLHILNRINLSSLKLSNQ